MEMDQIEELPLPHEKKSETGQHILKKPGQPKPPTKKCNPRARKRSLKNL